MKRNTLHYGDCLEVMRDWPDACVDLIYLDPPFNSKVDYNILFGNQKIKTEKPGRKDFAQMTAFTDTWEWNEKTAQRIEEIRKSLGHGARNAVLALNAFYKDGAGMLAYLVYMADRINAMHRLLKDTGSFYLHCDPTASHYLKMILDDVFGGKNFRNEIVWYYKNASRGKKRLAKSHDIIFYYAKSDHFVFNREQIMVPFESGMTQWRYTKGGQAGKPVPKGKTPDDVITLPSINAMAKERLGYPTQKPLALLDRIVKASSNEGDVVLDPFCGCGTTIEAAMNLKRDFAGIDISMYALDVIQKKRLKDVKFTIEGVPFELSTAGDMARKRPFAFEKWAIHCIPGFISNNKQTADGGVDGWGMLLNAPPGEEGMCIAQVKGGKPGVDSLRAFTGKLIGGYASVGVFITLEKWDTPTVRKCISDAGTLKQGANRFNRLVLWSVEEYFAGVPPKLPTLSDAQTGAAMQADLMTQTPSP